MSTRNRIHLSTLGDWSGLSWFSHYGAYLVGVVEIIASILLFSRWHILGALAALGVMTGVIYFHLFTPLGILMLEFNSQNQIVGNDGGTLFILACLVWLSAMVLVIRYLKSSS